MSFENFPYVNFHELNLDWIAKIAKDFLEQYTHIQELISNGEQSLQNLTASGLEDLQAKADELEQLLQEWYNTHSEDIANQLADALADIQQNLEQTLNTFESQAYVKASQAMTSIPADYSELASTVETLKNIINNIFDNYPAWYNPEDVIMQEYYNHDTTGLTTTRTQTLVSARLKNGYRIKQGVEYYYSNLYLYFCPVVYDDGEIVFITESTNQQLTGTFTPVKDGYIYITVSCDSNGNILYNPVISDIYHIILNIKAITNKQMQSIHLKSDTLLDNAIPITKIKSNIWKTQFLEAANAKNIHSFYDLVENYVFLNNNSATASTKTFEPIEIHEGVTYYYYNLYAYFSIISYDGGTTSRLSASTSEGASGSFTATDNGRIYITVSTNRTNWMFANAPLPSYKEGAFNNIEEKRIYYCTKDGTGDFSNLVTAINTASENMDSVLYVGAGDWNLVNDFKAVYGTGCFDTSDPTLRASDIILKNRIHIIFSSDAYVHYEYPGSQDEGARQYYGTQLSIFRSGEHGFTLENLNISVTYARYCIHDDRGSNEDTYHNSYINCKMKLDNRTNDYATDMYYQCIGGGFGTNGYIEIIGSLFESLTGPACVSWHNSASANAKSKLVIKDSYFNNRIRFSWFGESTKISTLQVTGCSMGNSILHIRENASATVQNTEVIEWNNTIRN